MTARTVYALTSGEYSDYQVEALFEHREDADRNLQHLGDTVEEFILLGPGEDAREYRRQVVMAWVVVDPEGRIHDGGMPYKLTKMAMSTEDAIRSVQGANRMGIAPVNYPVKGWAVTICAATEEAAMKAARERAAKVASLVVEGMDPMQMEDR